MKYLIPSKTKRFNRVNITKSFFAKLALTSAVAFTLTGCSFSGSTCSPDSAPAAQEQEMSEAKSCKGCHHCQEQGKGQCKAKCKGECKGECKYGCKECKGCKECGKKSCKERCEASGCKKECWKGGGSCGGK